MTRAGDVWTVETVEGVAVVTFTRPPANWMDTGSLRKLAAVLEKVAVDEHVRVVMITGGVDGYFVAHADLDELAQAGPDGSGIDLDAWLTTTRMIEQLPQPTVGAIDGQAWGGGLELALSATMRIASERSHVGLPEVSIGLIPGSGGTQRLSRLVGSALAAELILGARIVPAPEAAALGLLNAVLPDTNFREEAVRWCRRVARQPVEALFAAKQAIVAGFEKPFEQGLALESRLFRQVVVSSDAQAGIASLRRSG